MKYLLSTLAFILSCEIYPAFGAGVCLSYFGSNSRTVNIGEGFPYYLRVLTPSLSLPIVTIHQSNGSQVYGDKSFGKISGGFARKSS
ncbi:MAG: hypothetical protein IPK68_10390 [Bdellovibrionales bacterium]|nr:hypothetical protein [Bdellovibrionales bacterium]